MSCHSKGQASIRHALETPPRSIIVDGRPHAAQSTSAIGGCWLCQLQTVSAPLTYEKVLQRLSN